MGFQIPRKTSNTHPYVFFFGFVGFGTVSLSFQDQPFPPKKELGAQGDFMKIHKSNRPHTGTYIYIYIVHDFSKKKQNNKQRRLPRPGRAGGSSPADFFLFLFGRRPPSKGPRPSCGRAWAWPSPLPGEGRGWARSWRDRGGGGAFGRGFP